MICMPSSEWMLRKGCVMAFGRMSRREGAQTPINTINVTPLVDVMLVLVVIFILAAPMLAASLRVQLPKAQAALKQPAVSKSDALMVEVSPAGEIWIRVPWRTMRQCSSNWKSWDGAILRPRCSCAQTPAFPTVAWCRSWAGPTQQA
jgi:biopolymer transport protein ExbD